MKRHPSSAAFTLVEMLTVMVVIAVLAGLILAVNGYVQKAAATERAKGEIKAFEAALENYKADNGAYPRTGDTDALDPRVHGGPVSGDSADFYRKANLDLYKALSGDSADKEPDGIPEKGNRIYYEFKREHLSVKKDKETDKIIEVKYIQDPWGNAYGYSTAGGTMEEEFQVKARKDRTAKRPSPMPGYNPTFDLWSTGGSNKNKRVEGEQEDVEKWVKNW